MGRIAKVLVNPDQPQSLVDALSAHQRVIDGGIEIGSPQDPRDPASTTPPNGVDHNGTIVNSTNSWFQVVLDDSTNLLNTEVTCTHNLGVPSFSGRLNVTWQVLRIEHDNTGAGAGSAISVIYSGGTVTDNSIQLRFFASGRTVTVAHPLTVMLCFYPA